MLVKVLCQSLVNSMLHLPSNTSDLVVEDCYPFKILSFKLTVIALIILLLILLFLLVIFLNLRFHFLIISTLTLRWFLHYSFL
jgi:hypothetical protein